MSAHWSHTAAVVGATFAASLVEFVEALTIVLAVGSVSGWRPVLIGGGAALAVLAALVLTFGRALLHVPLYDVQLVIGGLLVLFGFRWLRKAVLRSAGRIPLHDETEAFARQRAALTGVARLDKVAVLTAFKGVALEGLEVVFIVLAAGSVSGRLRPAGAGAAAAFLVVLGLGAVLRTPLARVPENTLKFAVGVVLMAFGTFWLGEGAGLQWTLGDLALFALVVVYWAMARVAVWLLRR
jgi:Ca2+/H+ antiporter, TMEM165/GDT1 family